MPWLRLAAAASLALLVPAAATRAQLVGENVNMVSGTEWPGGDPFLQRQNEPSIAVSSANPLHLLAGANDYRTVDLQEANATRAPGDAWLGVFKSFDGGQTWRSVLLPGFPQDTSPEGLASPLHGFEAAADPTVRAGTDGLFYVSGITFNRGSNLGQVFVSRFLDSNDKENGDDTRDRIRYLDAQAIDAGTSGQFLDKPWLAVDVPREGAGTCSLPGTPSRTVRAGNVYFVYSMFTGANSQSSKIMFTRSTDCGRTWAAPQKLSESNSVNQGTILAVDPVTGAVYVAWRRYATTNQTDAILFAKSADFGATFTKAAVVRDIVPFEQELTATTFRVHTFPALAVSVDAAGTRRLHLAWSQRGAAPDHSRIVMVTSENQGASWSAPVAIDATPSTDDAGNSFGGAHQVMPQLTFTQGRLMAVYYDDRFDHTRVYYRPNQPFVPDVTGRFYAEIRGPVGELQTPGASVFTPLIDDLGLSQVRHTLDVRVAQALPGPAMVFTSVAASKYRFGTRGDEKLSEPTAPSFSGSPLQVLSPTGDIQLLQQLQSNPPNLPMFKQGTVPFMGDYIDIAGPAFVRTAEGWAHNTAPNDAPVHYAVWTSNQDVRPPADGDWKNYTPVGGGGASLYDPAQTTPACEIGQEGMRNQNIYSARITEGLLVSSPQNVKPLSATLTRAFVVAVQNATGGERAVRITVRAPPGVAASFRNDGVALTSFDVAIPAASTITRSLFVRLTTSTDPVATLFVDAMEVADDGACLGALPPACAPASPGLLGSVTLNPPGSSPSLLQPDGVLGDISSLELYPPSIGAANVTSANVTSPTLPSGAAANVTSANVTSFHVSNPDSANVTSANVTSANVTSANITSANVTSSSLTSANVTSANVTSANITSAPLSDATYTVTNTGNTTHSYRIAIVGSAPPLTPLQLILTKTYVTPLGMGCQLVPEPHDVLLANIDDVSDAVIAPGTVFDPNIPDPRTTNATLSLAPGESAKITLRGVLAEQQMAQLTQQLAPVVVAHAGGSFAAPLLVASDGAALATPIIGVPYSQTLTAIGGAAPYAWSLLAGSLPTGLALSSGGVLSGTPSAGGIFTFTARVTDASGAVAAREYTLLVSVVASATTLTASPNPSSVGQQVTLTANVAAAGPGAGTPTGTVTFRDGTAVLGSAALAGGSATVATASLAAGTHALTATYAGDAAFAGSTSPAVSQVVANAVSYAFTGFLTPLRTAGTQTSPTSSGTQRFGSAVPVKWQLKSGGAFVTQLTSTRLLYAASTPACAGAPPAGAPVVVLYQPTNGATGGSTFRYDTVNQQFVFNWDTSSGVARAGCWAITLFLDDGSPAKVTIVNLK